MDFTEAETTLAEIKGLLRRHDMFNPYYATVWNAITSKVRAMAHQELLLTRPKPGDQYATDKEVDHA